jgi:hypothetical protein
MLEPVVEIWRLKRKSKSGGFLPGLFFEKNPLYVWKSYLWARKYAKISLPEKNTFVIGWIAEINWVEEPPQMVVQRAQAPGYR